MSRVKYFSGVQVASTGGTDEQGIPFIAYDNTKGDEPVRAEQLATRFACRVIYV